MLSAADNELLTRTGPDTAMGKLMRLYWIPFAFGADLDPDGVPMRVRLLGEELIAFRNSEGRVGLVDAYCAHRRAPLFFGRNEECGIRCVYHGWKFDADGKCVDMPNERPVSNFKDKVSIKSYPCKERNGIVWAYMQIGVEPPELPDFEWNTLPAEHVHLSIRIESCNWFQALEGEIDSSHGPFLHSRIDGVATSERSLAYRLEDKHPRFEVLEMDHGLAIAARRDVDEQNFYWRVSQFGLPFLHDRATRRCLGSDDQRPCLGSDGRCTHAVRPCSATTRSGHSRRRARASSVTEASPAARVGTSRRAVSPHTSTANHSRSTGRSSASRMTMRSTGIPRAIPISPVFQGSGYRTLRARREWARSPIDHASASEALTSASFRLAGC